jgi:TRAP-type transport system periplasmic protein
LPLLFSTLLYFGAILLANKKNILIALSSLFCFLLTVQAATTIKFATVAPLNSTWMNIMQELDQEVREKTADEVGFKFYAGGVLGDEQDVIRKIRFGQVHGGGFTGRGLGQIDEQVRILDLPYLFKSSAEADVVLNGMFDRFAGNFEDKGFVLLGWAEVGFVHFFTIDPVLDLKSLKAQKMWIWDGDPLAGAYFNELGLKPIPLALPDVLTSFQTGLINGAYASPYGASVLQWQTRVKYVSELPFTNACGAVLVSQKIWNKISPEHQEIIREVSRRKLDELTAASRIDNKAALKAFQDAGIELMPITDEETQNSFEELGIAVQNKLAGKMYDKDLLEEIRTLIKTQRSGS